MLDNFSNQFLSVAKNALREYTLKVVPDAYVWFDEHPEMDNPNVALDDEYKCHQCGCEYDLFPISGGLTETEQSPPEWSVLECHLPECVMKEVE